MLNSSLLELLKTLEPQEWMGLKECLSSDRHIRAMNLLLYIEAYKDDFGNDALNKKAAYTKLYPHKNYDDQRMREDMSMLNMLTKKFLTDKELGNQPAYQLHTLIALRKKGAWGVFGKEMRKANVFLSAGPKDEQYLLNQITLAQEKEQYLSQQPNRTSDNSLQERMTSLDNYYVLGKLKLYCEQLNRTQVLQTDYQPQLIEEIMVMVGKDKDALQSPQVLVYYHIAQMLLDKTNHKYFQQLKQILPANEQQFDANEARNVYRYLQNYCIFHINKGYSSYFNELLDIYKRLLANKLMVTGDKIDHTDYKNIVTTGLRLKDFKWTLKFIEDYQGFISTELREGAYLYNKANYLYESGQLAQASDLLVQQNFSDIFYNMSARHLLLKIFYDQEEFEALDYQVESFRIYLMRNKIISSTNKASNINFLKVMRRLSVAKRDKAYVAHEVSIKRKATIEKAINNYQPLANKNWLMEKTDGLNN